MCEKFDDLFNCRNWSSMLGNGYASLTVISFSFLQSITNLICPFFLGMMNAGEV
jgi:hypothetical protein